MRLRVTPHSASSGLAGDRVSSCLVSRVLQRIRWRSSGCPVLRSFVCACRSVPRVAPASASSGLAGDGSSSCPESRILQHIRRTSLRFPSKLRFRLCLPTHSPSCPGSCIFRLCRRRIFELPRVSRPSAPLMLMPWVSPQHCSFSCASQWVCELPRVPHLPALPWDRDSGLPRILFPLAPADGFPSCLGSRILRLCRTCVPGLPRNLHLRLGR